MSNNRNIELNTIANVFKALSSRSPLRVITRPVTCCTSAGDSRNDEVCACVGEIGQDLEISPSTVSH
ncbi:hypothetical protein J7M28_12275, partial [bacterium]|nr:hypothetical protein [bacterium]